MSFVSPPHPLEDPKSHLYSADVAAIQKVRKETKQVIYVRGDGDCFHRAFGIALWLKMWRLKDHAITASILERMPKLKDVLSVDPKGVWLDVSNDATRDHLLVSGIRESIGDYLIANLSAWKWVDFLDPKVIRDMPEWHKLTPEETKTWAERVVQGHVLHRNVYVDDFEIEALRRLLQGIVRLTIYSATRDSIINLTDRADPSPIHIELFLTSAHYWIIV